jgi:hypothetical protein
LSNIFKENNMVRCALVLNGCVHNVVEADPTIFVPSDGSVVVPSDSAQINWLYTGSGFVPNAPAAIYPTQSLSLLQFMSLFTQTEQQGITTSQDGQVAAFVLSVTGLDGNINLTDPAIIAGVNHFASVGLIATARVSTILAGQPSAQIFS